MRRGYLGNVKLKAAGETFEFTKDQVQEYIRCSQDPEYFIENYVKIINVDKGLISFNMYDYQKRMVQTFINNRFVITKMPRQSGKSVCVVSYILWVILFHSEQKIAILANKGRLARELLAKIKLAYEHLPLWLQQGIVSWNKGDIELENNCKVLAESTSSSAIRGESFNLIFLDEFAFVGNNIADDFFKSVYPTISSGKTTKCIIVSTPNGMNHFYKMWVEAEERRSNYVPLVVEWWETPGRDETWKAETIKNTSPEQFDQEFSCAFLGSTNTLISSVKLKSMTFNNPINETNNLKIYKEVQPNHEYVMTIDVSEGVGQDYSVINITDISEMPYVQVAVYRSNTINPMIFPNAIFELGKIYNDAYALIEVNSIGFQTASILYYDLEYENIIMTTMRGRKGQTIGGGFGNNSTLGVKMTKQVKSIGCASLKGIIENDKYIIHDYNTVEELSTFISRGSSFEAEDGSHDDIVMTLVVFSWMIQQEYFKDLSKFDLRKALYEEQEKGIEEEITPFGIIDDGLSDDVMIDDDGQVWHVDKMTMRL